MVGLGVRYENLNPPYPIRAQENGASGFPKTPHSLNISNNASGYAATDDDYSGDGHDNSWRAHNGRARHDAHIDLPRHQLEWR
jgi:hypothetical protein